MAQQPVNPGHPLTSDDADLDGLAAGGDRIHRDQARDGEIDVLNRRTGNRKLHAQRHIDRDEKTRDGPVLFLGHSLSGSDCVGRTVSVVNGPFLVQSLLP